MTRPRRILLNSATAISLVLFVATLVVWVRSHRVADRFYRLRLNAADAQYFGTDVVMTRRGRLIFQFARLQSPAGAPDGIDPFGHHSLPPDELEDPVKTPGVTTFAGFGWGRLVYSMGYRRPGTITELVIPLYALALAFSVPPLLRVRTWRRSRRDRNAAGLCPHCGYDLRATPDRCPSAACGFAPPPFAVPPCHSLVHPGTSNKIRQGNTNPSGVTSSSTAPKPAA